MFKIIEPITITDSKLSYSNIVEDDYDEWSSGTTYSIGDYCIEDHKIYLCKVSNTGETPTTSSNIYDDSDSENITGYWTEISATNRWRMFDGKSRAVSSNTDSVEFSVIPGSFFNAIALLNVEADAVTVVVNDPIDGEVYRRSVSMIDNSEVTGWYSWLNASISKKSNFVLTDLPAYPSATVTVTATDTNSTVDVGEFVSGVIKHIGSTQYGYTIAMSDYSTKSVDDGVATLEEGVSSDTGSYTVLVKKSKKAYVKKILRNNRAKGIVFIGHEDSEETIAYAFLTDFDMSVENNVYAYCSIDYEELSA